MNAWQYVTVTFDNTSTVNRPVFYINGVLVATSVETAPAGTLVTDAASAVTIGNSGPQGRAFDGAIDDARIYNRVLSAAEIQALAAGSTPANAMPPTRPKNLRMQ